MSLRPLSAMFVVAALFSAGPAETLQAIDGREEPQAVRSRAAEAAADGQEVPPQGDPLTVPEVERMWDSYLAAQAKTALGLNEAQFVRFAARLQSLQNLRRQQQRHRRELMAELSGLVRGPGAVADRETAIAKLLRLDELSVEDARELLKAYAAIDTTLTIRQRVRFRTFEERMGQQKLELLAEARRAARGRGQGPVRPFGPR